jgi:hypothetical protein
MVKVPVLSIVLYGCETWTLLADDIAKLEALEIWLWRKLKKCVTWLQEKKSEVVWERMSESELYAKERRTGVNIF